MSSKIVSPYWESDKRFNINWQTFGLISLVMSGLVLCFLLVFSQLNEQQFEDDRESAHLKYQAQLERLIETSAEKMIQLSGAVSFNQGLMEAIRLGNVGVYSSELDALDWNLQTDSGISIVGLYNLENENLYDYGEAGHQESVLRVVKNERAFWQIDCNQLCRIVTYTALLHRGEVNAVLALAEPLSNVMLRFQRVANIDTGLLAEVNQEDGALIPSWERSLVALTNPEESKHVLNRASEDYSLEELRQGVGLISMNDALYELKAMPIQGNQVVVISEVSDDYFALNESKDQTLWLSAYALVLGEVLLLIFLWRPLKKIKMSEQLEGFVVKQAEMLQEKTIALSRAQSLSENLCDSMSAAVLILDDKGGIKIANQYFTQLLGLSSEQIIKRNIDDFVTADNIQVRQRVLDVSKGVIDEYEYIGRLSSSLDQSHKMIWRYVPSYYCGEDLGTENERSIVVIGMPLMLPTLESEQQWLDTRDKHTGLLNRDGMCSVIEDYLNNIETEKGISSKAVLSLFRFDEKLFDNTQIEHALLRVLSSIPNHLNNLELDGISQVFAGRLDANEVLFFCTVDSDKHTKDAVSNMFSDLLNQTSEGSKLDLGSFKKASFELDENSRFPFQVLQSVQGLI